MGYKQFMTIWEKNIHHPQFTFCIVTQLP